MIIDFHTHVYSPSVIANVTGKEDLVRELQLQAEKATARTSTEALRKEAAAAGVAACVLLPTAAKDAVRRVNRRFQEFCGVDSASFSRLHSLGTLHPDWPEIAAELKWFTTTGVPGVKLCSFSQAFDLYGDATRRMFSLIEEHNAAGEHRLFVILDTFSKAGRYFGARKEHLTTPRRLGLLVSEFPGIDFVGAHMAGLAAPFSEVLEHLPPRENFYLETSNAAHTLEPESFIRLLRLHGPDRILFGTDWPWFGQREELNRVEQLADQAGFGTEEKAAIFGGNAARLLGLADD
jgi:predicted TIM-barrel fold metal-dependent hydrolase